MQTQSSLMRSMHNGFSSQPVIRKEDRRVNKKIIRFIREYLHLETNYLQFGWFTKILALANQRFTGDFPV